MGLRERFDMSKKRERFPIFLGTEGFREKLIALKFALALWLFPKRTRRKAQEVAQQRLHTAFKDFHDFFQILDEYKQKPLK